MVQAIKTTHGHNTLQLLVNEWDVPAPAGDLTDQLRMFVTMYDRVTRRPEEAGLLPARVLYVYRLAGTQGLEAATWLTHALHPLT